MDRLQSGARAASRAQENRRLRSVRPTLENSRDERRSLKAVLGAKQGSAIRMFHRDRAG